MIYRATRFLGQDSPLEESFSSTVGPGQFYLPVLVPAQDPVRRAGQATDRVRQVKQHSWHSKSHLCWVKGLTQVCSYQPPLSCYLTSRCLPWMYGFWPDPKWNCRAIFTSSENSIWENSSNGLHFYSPSVCVCSSREPRWNVSILGEPGCKVTHRHALWLI